MTEIVDDTLDTIVVDSSSQDEITDESASDTIDVGEIIVVNRNQFIWLDFEESDWVETSSYYKLVIPYSTHQCSNAYVGSMLIDSLADSGDEGDANGYENNIPTWKLLPNDSIVIKADEPVDCKILIKGEV